MSAVHYIRFQASGRITSYGWNQKSVVDAFSDHMEAPEGTTDLTHYVKNGALVPLPPKPSENHVFDYSLEAWFDPRTLGQLKAAKWAQIKARRDEVEFGGFVWDGSVFDSDPLSQSRIQGAAQLATLNPGTFSIDWTLANNSVRTLSAAQMVEVGETLGIHVATQHTIARGLRQQIDAATTAAEVGAIVWP